ncbi:MAG: phosphate ABC transporter substrate-binding protein PstS [Paludibacteraceae bacterium]|nr:phosphate ABC transporter substrate-binding protein PstS [Paludibacteraceae bacterium]MED9995778.1 phosphate ABC transporter substrate-binding protein PstS [Paludibacteraceae bacterium]
MKMTLLKKMLVAVAVSATITACSNGAVSSISGAGATFPLPFYNAVFGEYALQTGIEVAYGGIGSGGGVRSLRDGVVNFAGSDACLSDEEMQQMPEVVHIPSCMGAVVLAYNIPGVETLHLSGQVIAEIYQGIITKWNDAKLLALNPGVNLPDKNIVPVFRTDGSGTTYVFTDFLSKASPSWQAKMGTGKSVNFEVGIAAKGNPGVANSVSQTPYTIGYVGSEYAFAKKIPYANVQNARGQMVEPTLQAISLAASCQIPQSTCVSITYSDVPNSYPISCFTWMLVYKEQNYAGRLENQAQANVQLLQYMLSDQAQTIAQEMNYAPLPKEVIELSRKNIQTLTYNGMPVSVN